MGDPATESPEPPLTIDDDPDTPYVAFLALRHALAFRGEVPEALVGWLRRHWSRIPRKERRLMEGEITIALWHANTARKMHYQAYFTPDRCRGEWHAVLTWMREEDRGAKEGDSE